MICTPYFANGGGWTPPPPAAGRLGGRLIWRDVTAMKIPLVYPTWRQVSAFGLGTAWPGLCSITRTWESSQTVSFCARIWRTRNSKTKPSLSPQMQVRSSWRIFMFRLPCERRWQSARAFSTGNLGKWISAFCRKVLQIILWSTGLAILRNLKKLLAHNVFLNFLKICQNNRIFFGTIIQVFCWNTLTMRQLAFA